MTNPEQKVKTDVLSQNINILKDKKYINLEVNKLKNEVVMQLDDSIFSSQLMFVDIDENRNGVIDILENSQYAFMFEGLPITHPIKELLKKMNNYFMLNERIKEKLIRMIIVALDYADSQKEKIKLVPVDATTLDQNEVDMFRAKVRPLIIAYRDDTTVVGRKVLFQQIKDMATTQEKKVWINSIAIEELGDEVVK